MIIIKYTNTKYLYGFITITSLFEKNDSKTQAERIYQVMEKES